MIIKQPQYKVIQRSAQASFECVIKHDPTLIPTVIWLKDNNELPDDERYRQNISSLIFLFLVLLCASSPDIFRGTYWPTDIFQARLSHI